MTLVLQLIQWWILATCALSVLLVILVVVQSMLEGLRRPARAAAPVPSASRRRAAAGLPL